MNAREQEYAGLQRAYKAHLHCRRIAIDAEDEQAMFQEFCRMAVEDLGYRMAWIGLIDRHHDRVQPVAYAGLELDYLERARITWRDTPRGRGPTGSCIRQGRPVTSQNIIEDPLFEPWREDAVERGYASSTAIPIFDRDTPIGALNLYAAEPDAFDEPELALLEEVAIDLMLGMHRHRLDASVASLTGRVEALSRQEAAYMATLAITHDLGTVLTSVSWLLDQVQSHPDGPDNPALIASANQAVERSCEMVRHMVALSRRADPAQDRPPLEQIVGSAASLLGRLVPNCTFTWNADCGPARVPLPSLDVERVLINLVVNAGQAMSDGGEVHLEIDLVDLDDRTDLTTGTLAPGTYARLAVSDTGDGIPTELMPKIFDEFFSTKGAEGTGLGLHAVKFLTQQADGEVEVTASDPGTVFRVYLPVVQAGAGDNDA